VCASKTHTPVTVSVIENNNSVEMKEIWGRVHSILDCADFLENGTNTKACIPGMEGTPDLTLVGG